MRVSTPSAFFSLLSVYTTLVAQVHAQGGSIAIDVQATLPNTAAAPTVDRSFISYSMELAAITGFTRNQMTNNIYNVWFQKTGGRPAVRIGGSGMDKSVWVPGQKEDYVYNSIPGSGSQWTFGPSFFTTLTNYFHKDTEVTFGLNLANTTDNWRNTIEFAVAAKNGFPQIDSFEIGNEVDNFVHNKLRKEPWNTKDYAQQWSNVARQLAQRIPGIDLQPGAYTGGLAKDFNFQALVANGVQNNNFRVPKYAMHFYSQSYCSGRTKVRINDLIDHNRFLDHMRRFQPSIDAAEGAGGQYTWGEANTVSCSGAPDISDTFAAALWLVDWALLSASKNIHRVYLHSTLTTAYTMFLPNSGDGVTNGIRPLIYGMYFLAETLALPQPGSDTKFMVTPVSIPGDFRDIVAYGLYANKVQMPAGPVASGSASVRTVTSTIRETRTTTLSGNRVSTIRTVVTTRVPNKVVTLTRKTVVTVNRTTRVPKPTIVTRTETKTKSSLGKNKVMTITEIVYIYGQRTTVRVPSVVKATVTSTIAYTTAAPSGAQQNKVTTIQRVTTINAPVTTTIVSSRVTTYTTTVPASAVASAPASSGTPGVYLARAVVLNLQRWNTSDTSALNCRSCSRASPSGFGSQGTRPKTSVTLSGFQPNRDLKLVRLQSPGLNAKSKVNVSGFTFNEQNGMPASEIEPERVKVDGSGKVKFDINSTEGVLLVDETVR